MAETLARLVPFFRPSQRDIRVRQIADAAFEMGRAVGDAEGYDRCLRERSGLGPVARQRSAPACEAAPS